MGFFDSLQTWMSGGDTSDAYSQANKLLEERKKNAKSTEQIYQEGRAAAGQAAADKAGQAKKAAKGAAMMGGAGKLQSAIAGAGAAADAASQGYSETANQAAAVGANQEANLNKLTEAQAANLTNQAESEAKRKAATRQGALSAAATVLSDCSSKVKKHHYIPKEER